MNPDLNKTATSHRTMTTITSVMSGSFEIMTSSWIFLCSLTPGGSPQTRTCCWSPSWARTFGISWPMTIFALFGFFLTIVAITSLFKSTDHHLSIIGASATRIIKPFKEWSSQTYEVILCRSFPVGSSLECREKFNIALYWAIGISFNWEAPEQL